MIKNIETTVIDAGGRYGLHPSWKSFTGELKYFLFEPDHDEASRLEQKYIRRSNEIKVMDCALLDKKGTTRLFLFHNLAMSSCYRRNPVSPLYKNERLSQENVVGHRDVQTTSIDSFCEENQISLDFMKLDTEGSEYTILQGAKSQLLHNVLGVRCEVSFDYVFENMPLFSAIHDFMLTHGFFLLNLDYIGKGDYCNEFVEVNGRYGVLIACDGVWLKRSESLFNPISTHEDLIEIRVLKYAAFCLNNQASDLAIDILLQGRKNLTLDFNKLNETRLYKFLDIAIHKLFYNLKWQPGQSLEKHKQIYFGIFNKPMMEMHEYNQSLELNPD